MAVRQSSLSCCVVRQDCPTAPMKRPASEPKMGTKSVQLLVDDIRLLSEANYRIVESVRAMVKETFESTSEEVKYGGILFTSGVRFCGVFAYTEHVSVEFGYGARIKDKFGHLEGSGKGRRHLKLRTEADIKSRKLAEYLLLGHQAAGTA